MIVTLNDLEIEPADIFNKYIQATVTDKLWTILGPEFGSDASMIAVIARALYGQQLEGAGFRSHLASCMESMGYLP